MKYEQLFQSVQKNSHPAKGWLHGNFILFQQGLELEG